MSNYPPDWDSRRRRVYRRDNYTCTNCGGGGDQGNAELHAHHVVPISKGGSHELSNLTTLCKRCHNSIHHNDVMAPTADPGTGATGFSGSVDEDTSISVPALMVILFFLIGLPLGGFIDGVQSGEGVLYSFGIAFLSFVFLLFILAIASGLNS